MNNQPNSDNKKTSNALRVARISIFTALSVIGSFIAPYPPLPTIAFDSSPGFFAALYFGVIDGFIVTGLGHIVSAIMKSFPLGNLHFIIALGMALAGGAIGLVNKTNKKWGFIPATITGVAINTALSLVMLPQMDWPVLLSMVTIPLLLAASLNAAIAAIIYVGVRARRIIA
ncbi:MAG: hypothetical protein CW716_03660 [Candidatus Bathyarchaeum sp.]|nr:MAG: hypothetical protein CW716_03660 [Candidatus Bathyarchaeum sp.]